MVFADPRNARMQVKTDSLLSRLEKVRSNGDRQWLACCPAHDDRTPSLSIKETRQGSLLVHCFAGCDTGEILAAVGLTLADLFPNDSAEIRPIWWARKERADVEREADRLRLERLVLAIADEQRQRGERLAPADLERERVAWLRVHRSN